MNIENAINHLLHIVLIFEGIAALTSIICYKNYKNRYLKYLPILLCLVFFNEILAIFFIQNYNKSMLYNLMALTTFNYYFWLYRNAYVKPLRKSISFYSVCILNFVYVLEFVLYGCKNVSLAYSYTIGGLFLIMHTIFYFMKKLEEERVLILKQDLLFWLSAGNLLFYVGYLPIKLSRMLYTDITNHYNYLHLLHFILILVLNACIIIGLKWARQKA